MTTKEIFAQRMRELRQQSAQPQKVLAEQLGVSVNQVSEMEKGTRMTTLEKLAVICCYYNVSADYLLGLTDEKRPPDSPAAPRRDE